MLSPVYSDFPMNFHETPLHLLKVPKFLAKISQFKFLVMTRKNIYICKFLVYLCKNCNPLKKVTPFFHLLIAWQEIIYQPSFALISLSQKMMHFQRFFLLTYSWSVFILLFCAYVFLRMLFHISAIIKLWIASYSYICITFYLASRGIIIFKVTSSQFSFQGN